MTVPASIVPDVKAYMFTALKARSELAAPVLVAYAIPAVEEFLNDTVCLGDFRGQYDPLAMVGSGGQFWLEETFELDLHVFSFFGLDDPKGVEQRALALAAVGCDVVRTDPEMGGLVTESRPTTYVAEDVFDDEQLGRHMHIVQTIRISATS